MQTIKNQRGTIAIEFAALFAIFFVIIYAIIAYSIPLLLTSTFKQVSSDASRAAIRVDIAYPHYTQKVSEQVTKAVGESWLPTSWVDGNCPTPKNGPWTKLPAVNGKPSYGFFSFDEESGRYTLQVCLQRKYGSTGAASDRAIIPTINILGIKIPSLPEVNGETVIRSHTTVRL
ncbi:MAG: pilus assembly protein [Pseudomonas sp.]|nr:pilus assembly protein [Pseudomonas sp.]